MRVVFEDRIIMLSPKHCQRLIGLTFDHINKYHPRNMFQNFYFIQLRPLPQRMCFNMISDSVASQGAAKTHFNRIRFRILRRWL